MYTYIVILTWITVLHNRDIITFPKNFFSSVQVQRGHTAMKHYEALHALIMGVKYSYPHRSSIISASAVEVVYTLY